MWSKLLSTDGLHITSAKLNLKNTLMNGQCFNWRYLIVNNSYVGCVNRNVIILKEEHEKIFYQFLCKNSNILTQNDEHNFFTNYFQLEVNIEEIYSEAKLKLPKNLQSIMDTYKGIRILKQEVFECIISFICSSNNNIDRIRKMLESFKKVYGVLLYEDETNGQFYSFPNLDELMKSKINEDELRNMGFGYRAKYIIDSINFMSTKNSDWLTSLETCENPVDELLNLTGVGRKVADCILLFSLKKHSVVPLDIHMIKFFNESVALQNKFTKIEKLNKKTYEEASINYINAFGNYAGWLHSIFYLNRIDKETKGAKTDKRAKEVKNETTNKTEIKKGKRKADDNDDETPIDKELNKKKKKK